MEIIEAPVPFILGIPSMFKHQMSEYENENLIIFDLDINELITNENTIVNFPRRESERLINELNSILYEEYENWDQFDKIKKKEYKDERRIREVFLTFISSIIGSRKNNIKKEKFNETYLYLTKDPEKKNFLISFIDTICFQEFNNCKKNYFYDEFIMLHQSEHEKYFEEKRKYDKKPIYEFDFKDKFNSEIKKNENDYLTTKLNYMNFLMMEKEKNHEKSLKIFEEIMKHDKRYNDEIMKNILLKLNKNNYKIRILLQNVNYIKREEYIYKEYEIDKNLIDLNFFEFKDKNLVFPLKSDEFSELFSSFNFSQNEMKEFY
jgi:hypothetical protein